MVLNLLKHSLVSKQPLTDLFLRHEIEVDPMPCPTLKERARPLKAPSCLVMNVNEELKLFLSKSTHTVLYAEAGETFVNLLLAFLNLNLQCTVKLLDGNSTVGSIDNLTNSIKGLSKEKYMINEIDEHKLVKPMPRIFFDPRRLALPIAEEFQIPLYYHLTEYSNLSCHQSYKALDVMQNTQFLKWPAKFMIMDGLDIVPASAISGLSCLGALRVSFDDVEEKVLKIGQEEALTLLKACLTSKSVLSDFLQVMCGAQS